MQRGSLVLFMILSVVILLGWVWLQPRIWPPKFKEPKKEEAKKEKKESDGDFFKARAKHPETVYASLVANRCASVDPLLDLVRLSVDAHNLPDLVPLTLSEKEKRLNAVASALTPPSWPDLAPSLAQLAVVRLPEPAAPAAKAETETIGGEGYFIEATLTTLGAGVQSLTLTQFEAANYLGKPIEGKKLELIGEDPFVPSFLMYHYADPRKDPESYQPVLTLGAMHWKPLGKTVKEDRQEVKFTVEIPDPNYQGWHITKTYRLERGAYHLTLLLEIENRGSDDKARELRYQLAGSHGMPLEGQWYTSTYRDALIALVDKRGTVDRDRQDAATISHREGGNAFPATASGSEQFLRYAGVSLQYFASMIAVEGDANILAWARPTKESSERAGTIVELEGNHMVFQQGERTIDYTLLPRTLQTLKDNNLGVGSKAVVSEYVAPKTPEFPLGRRVATWIRPGNSPRPYFDDVTVRVNTEPIKVVPGGKARHEFTLYHGPAKVRLLRQFGGDKTVPEKFIDHYINELRLNTITDYRSSGFFGWLSNKIWFTDLLILVTNLMHTLLYWFHFLVGGWGLAIILLTVLVRGMMFPISRKQALFSMKMQELAPELKKIQEKYKGDPRARTEATMEFYRRHRINPFASCLPLLMQLPIFLGLYFALQESIHFRLAGFLWIENLAAPDMLIYWSQSIPWVSDPDNIGGMLYLGPYFNLLPIVAVFLMLAQQKMMTPPAMDEQQAMQMKIMKFMMIFIGILFYKVAAGLAIYFIASSLWGLAERRLLPKKEIEAAGKPAQPAWTSKGGPPGKGGPGGKSKPAPKEETGPFARLKRWWADVLKEAKKK